jgi:hypothetical protein
MARASKVLFLVAAVACFWATDASAQCPTSSPFGHYAFGGFITNCADAGPVSGFAYAMGTTVNSGAANIICEAEGEIALGGTGCAGAGALGDGIITIEGDWANTPQGSGCPNPNNQPGVGRNVVVIRDSRGAGLLLSAGYEETTLGYPFDFAHRDDGSLSCSMLVGDTRVGNSSSVEVSNVRKTTDGTMTTVMADVTAVAPRLFSDCDPDSLGIAFGGPTCFEGAPPTVGAGRVMWRAGDCTGAGLDLRLAGWQAWTGSAIVPTNSCLFIGGTAMIGGSETPGVTSAVAILGDLAPAPRALDVRARRAGGDVIVDFHTTTEVGLLGLEIVTKSGRKILDVAPRGAGGSGATYSVKTARGDYRNEREVIVVAITAEGRFSSDPARF